VAGSSPVLQAAGSALLGAGREVHLDLRVREHHGPDVATLHDDVACSRASPLLGDHRRADFRDPCDGADGLVDLRRPDGGGDVAPPDRDARVDGIVACVLEGDAGVAGQCGERGGVVQADAADERLLRDGAVHRARVEVAEPEPSRQGARDGGLP